MEEIFNFLHFFPKVETIILENSSQSLDWEKYSKNFILKDQKFLFLIKEKPKSNLYILTIMANL